MLLLYFSRFLGLLRGYFSRSSESLFGKWVVRKWCGNDPLRSADFSFPVYKNRCVSGDWKGVRVAELVASWSPISKAIHKVSIPATAIPDIEAVVTFPETVI